MARYEILYAEDIPHYCAVDIEADSPEDAIRIATDYSYGDAAADPDWSNPVCKRIVTIHDEAGEAIAEDISLDGCSLRYDGDAEERICDVIEHGAHRDYIAHSRRQNIAAISGDFHTHRLYGAFYDTFGTWIDGFVGQYELCIAMADALTEWEIANGMGEAYDNAGVPWIEVVEDFVETVLKTAIRSGELPEPAQILPAIKVLWREQP